MTMTALIRAEITKLRTTATARWLLVATAVLAVLAVIGIVLTANTSNIDLATPYGVRAVLHAAATGSLLVLVLGVIGMTGEFRTGTITDTLLTTPRRDRVVVAKLITYLGAGLVFGVVAAVVSLGTAAIMLTARGESLHLGDPEVWLTPIGTIGWAAIYGALGVSVGALVRSQVAAIVGVLAWLMVGEQLVVNLVKDLGRWLPGAAAEAFGRAPASGLLSMRTGGLALAAYVLALAALAVRSTMRRDVT
jgi:ABC-2 type transport system permease protein